MWEFESPRTDVPYKDRAQQSAYQIAWRNRRREAWFKENGPCSWCGSWKDLQLDHKDPAKKVSHKIWSWSEARRSVELVKCQALCVTCHKIKSSGEKAKGEANGHAKLTEDDVRAIRASTESLRVLGSKYNVDFKLIHHIKRGERWKHVV